MASNEVWEPLSASRMDILNKNRIAVEQKKAAEWKKAKETKRKIISVISGLILAIIGFIMFIGGFRPNLASDGPTMRVLLIGGWTSLLTATGVLLVITGTQNKSTLSKLPIVTGVLAAICFTGFFVLTYT